MKKLSKFFIYILFQNGKNFVVNHNLSDKHADAICFYLLQKYKIILNKKLSKFFQQQKNTKTEEAFF